MRPWRGAPGEQPDGDADLVGRRARRSSVGEQRRLLAALGRRRHAARRRVGQLGEQHRHSRVRATASAGPRRLRPSSGSRATLDARRPATTPTWSTGRRGRHDAEPGEMTTQPDPSTVARRRGRRRARSSIGSSSASPATPATACSSPVTGSPR